MLGVFRVKYLVWEYIFVKIKYSVDYSLLCDWNCYSLVIVVFYIGINICYIVSR